MRISDWSFRCVLFRSVRAGADVVEHQLVGAGIAIARRQRDDVAHVDVVAEAHALDYAAGTHVEAGDDAAAQHASVPARLIRPSSSARPSTMPAQPAVFAARMSAMSRAPPAACTARSWAHASRCAYSPRLGPATLPSRATSVHRRWRRPACA